MKDIKRVWMYHGAEHKTINCYEANEELTVENVMKYPTSNRRCGTSFMFLVMAVSIIVFFCGMAFGYSQHGFQDTVASSGSGIGI